MIPFNLPLIHQEYESKQKIAFQENGTTPSCQRGCCHCCYEPLYTTRQEVEYALDGLSMSQRDVVKRRTHGWQVMAESNGANLWSPYQPKVNGEDSAVAYRKLNMPCPFLQDQECMVYDRRPLSCREHVAVGPAEKCKDLSQRPSQEFVSVQGLLENLCLPVVLANVMAGNFIRVDHLGNWLARISGMPVAVRKSDQSASPEKPEVHSITLEVLSAKACSAGTRYWRSRSC